MKLQSTANLIERSQKFEESNYTIEATAKAFSILSDGLYANKVRAVVRELSTNAYDSHIDAGKPDVPFEVHLPNSMEPHFSIRDFGTGLSHEDCMNLYTTYFRSNRTDSNKSVGCMGLGSKSPFAYNDSFTVESFFDGKHRTYNAYKNEREEPVFALLNEQDTYEPNGLKVSFPVSSHTYDNDFDRFSEEAADLYRHFLVEPKITGQSIHITQVEYIVRGEDWGIREHDDYGQAHAVMGQVSYPLDREAMGDYPDECRKVLFTNIDLFFDIGEINITPSRESLSYNDFTRQSIIKKCEKVLKEAAIIIEESIAECDTLWDARIQYADITNNENKLGKLANTMQTGEVEWKGQKLFDDTNYGTSVSINNISGLSVVMYYRDGWKEAVQRDERTRISPNKYAHIYVDDMKRGAIGRVRSKVKEDTSSGRYAYGGNNKFRIYFVKGSEQAIKEMYETLGCKPHHVYKTSDLPKPDTANYNDSEVRTKIAVWNGSQGWKDSDNWDDVSKDLKEGGYFVEINRYKYRDTSVNSYSSWLSRTNTLQIIQERCKVLGIDIDKIYGVKSAVIKTSKFRKLQKAGVWVNIFDKVEEIALDLLDRKGYRGIIGLRNGHEDLFRYGNHSLDYDEVLVVSELTKTDNDLKKFMELYKQEQVEEDYKLKAVLGLCNTVNIKIDPIHNGINKEDFDKAEKVLWDKYPLIKDCVHNLPSNDFLGKEVSVTVKELARYVDFIERESNEAS